ncbi:MAG: DNRLRE domain-containing protein [Bacteroidia bacterium]|nr:DNRLRE domain-containing protein [Bacteroidia bacterium]
MNKVYYLLLLAWLAAASGTVCAQVTLTLTPAADNTLYESPNGALSNGAGDDLFAGVTNTGLIRRGVIRFDLSAIPPGANITQVTLTLVKNQGLGGPHNVNLHRITAAWGEGTSNAGGGGGGGAPSTANSATWIHTFFSGSFWAAPGGDFVAASSAVTSVGASGTYSWTSAQMAADVQSWIAAPNANFGWMLIGNESANQTAQRFLSKEFATAASRPRLSITYTTPCVNPVLNSLSLAADTVCAGGPALLTVSGALNSATAWQVYAGGCGAAPVAANSSGSFSLQPAVSTTYYVRGEGGCVTPGTCDSIRVQVRPQDQASFTYDTNAYCQNASNPTPVLTGAQGGSFSASPAGLQLNAATGEISLAASTPAPQYQITYISAGLCPDTAVRILSILPAYRDTADAQLCTGDTLFFGGQAITASGTYTSSFTSALGCDSTVVLQVSAVPVLTLELNTTICRGDTLAFGSLLLTQPGTYTQTFDAQQGCDTLVTMNLQVTVIDTTVTVIPNFPISLQAQALNATYQWLDCADNFSPIPGETNPAFTPSASGSYAVAITQGNCTDTSSCRSVTALALDPEDLTLPLRAYPNPAQDQVQIRLETLAPVVHSDLYTLQGAHLGRQTFFAAQHLEISLAALPAGLYLMQVSTGDRSGWVKIRKE